MERRMLARPDRPAVILPGSDSLAIATHEAATHAGLVPGRDVAVTGFDAVDQQIELDPALTSVRLPLEDAAARVVARVIAEIEPGPTAEPGVLIDTEIAIEGSA